MKPQLAVHLHALLCLSLIMCTHCLYTIETENRASEFILNYRAAENVWKVDFDNVRLDDFFLVFVQVCSAGGACDQTNYNQAVDCHTLNQTISSGGWVNDVVQVQPNGCLDLEPSVQDAQLRYSSVDANHSLYMVTPFGVHIQNTPHVLDTYTVPYNSTNTDGDLFKIILRIVFLNEIQANNTYSLTTNAYEFILKKHVTSIGTIAVQHECIHRGLYAPPHSMMHLYQNTLGVAVCVWTCRDDYVRYPWHSPAVPTNGTIPSSFSGLCRPLPSQFLASTFEFRVEVGNIINAGVLSQAFLDDIDLFGFEMEHEAQTTHPGSFLVLKVQSSVYDTMTFSDFIQRAYRFRVRGPYSNADLLYESLASNTASNTAPNTTARRRLLESSSKQINVEGLIITNESLAHIPTFESHVVAAFRRAADTHVFNPVNSINNINAIHILEAQRVYIPLTFSENTAASIAIGTQRTLVLTIEVLCALIVVYVLGIKQTK